MTLIKERLYRVQSLGLDFIGRYELTTEVGELCFWNTSSGDYDYVPPVADVSEFYPDSI